MSGRVAAIVIAPVKGLRAIAREEVLLGPFGVRENRRFFLIDAAGRMINAKRLGSLQAVVADYADAERTLALRFPDGSSVDGELRAGERIAARFFSRTVAAIEVEGPWSSALSEHAGEPLRLVESVADWGAVDRGRDGAVSLVSAASIARVAAACDPARPLDGRRFRMLFEIDGVGAHAEDGWLGRSVRVGEATVLIGGHVGRCAVTQLDPDSGQPDRDTLAALASYRGGAATTEPLACGVFGTVLETGTARVGDAVEPI